MNLKKYAVFLLAITSIGGIALISACAGGGALTASQQAAAQSVEVTVAKVCVPLQAVAAVVNSTSLIPAADQPIAAKVSTAVTDVCSSTSVTISTAQNLVDVVLPLAKQLVLDIDSNTIVANEIASQIDSAKTLADAALASLSASATSTAPASVPAAASSAQ